MKRTRITTPHPVQLGDTHQVVEAQKAQRLGRELEKAWVEQRFYNGRIMFEQSDVEGESGWAQIYLLGLVSEIDEILREINWKRHRREERNVSLSNLALELADLTKYVLSLWLLWGFEPSDMLKAIAEKNEILEFQWEQDRDGPMPFPHVILFDIDGTVADYRLGLSEYLATEAGAEDARTIFYQMDLAVGLDYEVYHHHKDRFEEEGGYLTLPGYPDAVKALKKLGKRANLCAVTARPESLARCWSDTYYWLKKNVRIPERLWLAQGERLKLAKRLREQGYRVAVWEDAPIEALRYAEHGFRVWMRNADYNQDVGHDLIERIETYSDDFTTYFGEVK